DRTFPTLGLSFRFLQEGRPQRRSHVISPSQAIRVCGCGAEATPKDGPPAKIPCRPLPRVVQGETDHRRRTDQDRSERSIRPKLVEYAPLAAGGTVGPSSAPEGAGGEAIDQVEL